MKKIITLLFFAGFLSSAFAQQDRHQKYDNQTGDGRSRYSGDNNHSYSKSYPVNNGYHKNQQWDKYNNDDEYGYNKERDIDRDDMRRDQYHHAQYENQKRYDYHPDRRRSKVPLFQIIIGIGGILK